MECCLSRKAGLAPSSGVEAVVNCQAVLGSTCEPLEDIHSDCELAVVRLEQAW